MYAWWVAHRARAYLKISATQKLQNDHTSIWQYKTAEKSQTIKWALSVLYEYKIMNHKAGQVSE